MIRKILIVTILISLFVLWKNSWSSYIVDKELEKKELIFLSKEVSVISETDQTLEVEAFGESVNIFIMAIQRRRNGIARA